MPGIHAYRRDPADFRRFVQDREERGVAEEVPNLVTSAVSAVSARDKFSWGFHQCLGIVVAGAAPDGAQELSVLAHRMPDAGADLAAFRACFAERLRELLARTERASLAAGYAAGSLATGPWSAAYQEMVDDLQDLLHRHLGIPAERLWTPKARGGGTAVTHLYLRTRDRTLLVMQRAEDDA